MGRIFVRVVSALLIAGTLFFFRNAHAGLSCSAGVSDAIRITNTSNATCITNNSGNNKIVDDAATAKSLADGWCAVPPAGTLFDAQNGKYSCGSVIIPGNPASYNTGYTVRAGWGFSANCNPATTTNLYYEISVVRSCSGSSCGANAGRTVVDQSLSAGNTFCFNGCTATKRPGARVCVVIGAGKPTQFSNCKYDIPTTGGVACSSSFDPFDGSKSTDTDGQGNTLTGTATGDLKINGATLADGTPLNVGDLCGSFDTPNGWIACNQAQPGSPPQPDNGTAGVPATPNFTIDDTNGGGVDLNLYSPGAVSSSSSGYGSAPSSGTGGQGGDAGGGTDPSCVGAQCDDAISGGATCASPPVCTGDPIQCYQAQKLWELSCKNGSGTELGDAAGINAGLHDGLGDFGPESELEDTVDLETLLPHPSASSCELSDLNMNILGNSIAFPFSFLCPVFVYVGVFTLIGASIFGFKIVAGGVL